MTVHALLERALKLEREHATILLDAKECVIEWLPSASHVLGYSAEEMMGATLEPLFTTEDLARGDLDWEYRAARSYGKSEDDRWCLRKDGVRIWASGVTTALTDDEGALLGYSKVLRDRTDLRSHIETLQARLESAAQAEHDKHVVLGTLAHELRSPLGPLANAAQLIRMTDPDNTQIRSFVQIIERQVGFIETLVRDLLETTRINVGKAQLHYERVDLREVVDRAVETCGTALKDRAH